jgi:hypothetical protein
MGQRETEKNKERDTAKENEDYIKYGNTKE